MYPNFGLRHIFWLKPIIGITNIHALKGKKKKKILISNTTTIQKISNLKDVRTQKIHQQVEKFQKPTI